MSLKIKNSGSGGGNFIYKIAVSHQPSTINYLQGESLDLTDLIVVGYYSNGDILEITDKCVFSPEEGTALDKTNDKIVIYMKGSGCAEYYTEQGIKVVIPVVFENVLNVQIATMCKGKDKYLISGYSENTNYYSSNGTTWTQNTSFTKYLRSIAYGNNKYVGVVFGEGPYYSTDGISWTKGNNVSISAANTSFVVYYDANRNIFILLDDNTSNDGAYYSTDGINWTATSFSSNRVVSTKKIYNFKDNIVFECYTFSSYYLCCFNKNNTIGIVSGISGTLNDFTVTDNYIYVSTSSGIYRCSSANLQPWEKVSDIVSSYIYSCNNNIYLKNNGKWNQTKDFNEFIELNIPYTNSFYIDYGNDKYIIMPTTSSSNNSNNFLYYSDDSITWNKSNISNVYVRNYICDKDNMIWLVSCNSDASNGVFYWK